MMLVAVIALSGSTFAWFAVNNKVTATGMSFTTKVSDNLFIADAAHADTTIKAESAFQTTSLQTVTGVLEPVSSNDGKAFWYAATDNVNGDGQVKNNAWKNYGTEGLTVPDGKSNNAFSVNYIPSDDTVAVGFVDYVYDLKAIAGEATTLNLTKLDLTYADKVDATINSAVRVAVFVEPAVGTGDNTGSNYTVTAAKDNVASVASADVAGTSWIFAPTDKATNNFTTKGIDNAVITGAEAVDTMTYKTDAATISIGTAGTYYYKVVVRTWLEGQDKNCNNTTFAKLDDGKWGLTTEWTLGAPASPAAPVTAINVVESLKSGVDLSTAEKTSTTMNVNGTVYAELSVEGYWVDNSADFTSASRVFTIEGGMLTEVTHIVKLPNPAP